MIALHVKITKFYLVVCMMELALNSLKDALNGLHNAIHRCENCGKPLETGWICRFCGWDNLKHKESGK